MTTFYGYCTTDDPNIIDEETTYEYWDASAYCVLDNDYSSTQFPNPTTPLENLQVTAAHEYFHAVQFAYDIGEDAWLMEATATWVEDEVFDDDQRQPPVPRQQPAVGPARLARLDQRHARVRRLDLLQHLTERFPTKVGALPEDHS